MHSISSVTLNIVGLMNQVHFCFCNLRLIYWSSAKVCRIIRGNYVFKLDFDIYFAGHFPVAIPRNRKYHVCGLSLNQNTTRCGDTVGTPYKCLISSPIYSMEKALRFYNLFKCMYTYIGQVVLLIFMTKT